MNEKTSKKPMGEEMIKDSFRLPFDKCYIEANEYWLNQMAEKGQILSEIKRKKASFERHEMRIVYHIDLKHQGMAKVLNNKGWKPVCDYDRFMAVYANESKDPQVPVVEKESAEYELLRIVRQKEETRSFLRSCLIPMICIMLLAAYMVFYAGQEASILLNDGVLFGFVVIILLLIGWSAILANRMRMILHWAKGRSRKKAEDFYGRIKEREDKKWPSEDRIYKAVTYMTIALLTIELVICMISAWHVKTGPLELLDPYVALSDIEDIALDQAEISGFSDGFETRSSLWVPTQELVTQAGLTVEEGEERVLRVLTYKTRNEITAKDLYEARMAEELSWNSYMASYAQKLEVEGADSVYFASYMSMQYLFIRKGNTVITVFYLGNADLDEKVELFLK